MDKPSIAITGANGFIGSSLLQFFHDNNYRVIALVRKPLQKGNIEERSFDLRSSPQNNLLEGVDILIHCAFTDATTNQDAEKINYEGTKALVNCATVNGVKSIIFFSSVSAYAQATSSYGKSKLALESLFNPQKDVVLKCSLVIGNGGLFYRMLQHAVKKRIVPVIYGGQQPMQIIVIDDVLKAVQYLIDQSGKGIFVLANKESFTYRQFFETIARVFNKKIVFVPVPALLLQAMIYCSSLLRIKLPINKENLLGLQFMKQIDTEHSLHQLRIDPLTLEEKLQEILLPSY